MLTNISRRNFGVNRDKLIEEAVEKFNILTSEQIQLMFFNNLKDTSAKRQCQHRLKLMSDRDILKRKQLLRDEPYYYYIGDKKERKQIEHLILINWLFLWWKYKNPDYKIYYMEYEKDYKIIRPDLFVVYYDIWNKCYDSVFFEMDKTISNLFDKVEKYNELYNLQYHDQWTELVKGQFPKVVIATTNKSRLFNIQGKIAKQNEGHRFKAYYVYDLKEECINGQKSNSNNLLSIT